MGRRQPLSNAELEIAQIVWRLKEAPVRAVLDALPADRALDFATVQTFLRRLKVKGYLRTRREGRADVYMPAVKPTSVVKQLTRDFLDRTFAGQLVPLMQHLLHDQSITREEIDQLQTILNDLKSTGGRPSNRHP